MKYFLKNKNNFFAKNHCEVQACTILVCALYSIKYGTQDYVNSKYVQSNGNYKIRFYGRLKHILSQLIIFKTRMEEHCSLCISRLGAKVNFYFMLVILVPFLALVRMVLIFSLINNLIIYLMNNLIMIMFGRWTG